MAFHPRPSQTSHYGFGNASFHGRNRPSKRFIADADRLGSWHGAGFYANCSEAYCGLDPIDVNYKTDVNGKLSIPSCTLSFNLSTCEDRVAYLVTLEKDIGVDIEQVRILPELPLVIKSWFSLKEQAELAALPYPLQVEAFYHIWTKKKLFSKRGGWGSENPWQIFRFPWTRIDRAG